MEILGCLFGMMGFGVAIAAQAQTAKLVKELKKAKMLPDDY
jgi:hypothetical protein